MNLVEQLKGQEIVNVVKTHDGGFHLLTCDGLILTVTRGEAYTLTVGEGWSDHWEQILEQNS
jgi:hypothetical protein